MARKPNNPVNPELLKRAKEAALAQIAAQEAEFEKDAVIPGGGDPAAAAGGAPPMDPSMMGGGAPPMDPSMMGGDPSAAGGAPPMDPSMMGGTPPAGAMPPSDPMLGGGGMSDMINQAVQQALAAQGGGKGGGPGKAGKPDIAVELQKLQDTVYKMGLIVTAIANAQQIELPAAALLGPPPEASDPALAQAATAMPAPSAGPGGGDPSAAPDPAAQPFGQVPPMSGDPADAGAKQASASMDLAKLAGATTELERILGAYGLPDDSEFDKAAGVEDQDAADLQTFYDLIQASGPQKAAGSPDVVGRAYGDPAPVYHSRTPLSLASKIRSKVRS